ncbi:selenoprotein Pb-like [Mya arenaria]|nr:selenoprotein Pb-like [Mya arenaria]
MDNVEELVRRVSFPVYQDTARGNIWNLLGGGKDDVLFYDKCGMLTYHIRYPDSLLSKHHFQDGLWGTYYSNPCSCDPNSPRESQHNSYQSNENSQPSHQDHHEQQHHNHHHGDHQHHHHGRVGRQRRHVNHRKQEGVQNVHALKKVRAADSVPMFHEDCRHDDTLCQVLSSTRLRFRKRYKARRISRLVSRQNSHRNGKGIRLSINAKSNAMDE